jgi:arylsulfatase A-like enzyme
VFLNKGKIRRKCSSLLCHSVQEEFESQVIRRGMISALDAAIGKLVTTLKTTGQYNNTVIVFSSDSGSGNLNQMELGFLNPQEHLP